MTNTKDIEQQIHRASLEATLALNNFTYAMVNLPDMTHDEMVRIRQDYEAKSDEYKRLTDMYMLMRG